MTAAHLEDLVRKKQIIVCCGSGGVGKTTITAALAVHAALIGKRVLALTVDPARRLADSLGIAALGNTEHSVPDEHFLRYGRRPSGSLSAMMLDTKRTFDELIERYAPSPEAAQEILKNRFYQNLSSAMAGSHEYLAMERLYQIHLTGRYDLVVLDTPPTRHALDFLEAPGRVRAFFDRSVRQWFLKPYLSMGRLGLALFNRTAGTVLRLVERFTGAEFLHDVSEFIAALADAFDIFHSRAEEVMHILRADSTTFLLVTGPQRAAMMEAAYFRDRLREASLPFGGIIVNRFHHLPSHHTAKTGCEAPRSPMDGCLDPEGLVNHLQRERGMPAAVAERLARNLDRYLRLYQRDQELLEEFVHRFGGRDPLITIPAFGEDIHDLKGLLNIDAHLFRCEPC